jgi:SNF2 family DNA or RNA helicase
VNEHLMIGTMPTEFLRRFCQINGYNMANINKDCERQELLQIAKNMGVGVFANGKKSSAKKQKIAYNKLLFRSWSFLVMDEIHRIKNHGAHLPKSVSFLLAKYRIGISGSPIMNTPNELSSILKYGLNLQDWEADVMDKISLGRKKMDVPELLGIVQKKTEEICLLKWEDKDQRHSYCMVKNDAVDDYMKMQNKMLSQSVRAESKRSFLDKMMLLRQICLHPLLPRFTRNLKNPKAQRGWCPSIHFNYTKWIRDRVFTLLCCLRRFPNDLRITLVKHFVDAEMDIIQPSTKMLEVYQFLQNNPDEKIIVFCTFKVFLISIMKPWLDQIGIHSLVYSGDVLNSRRSELVTKFEDDPEIRVLLIVKKCGGEGLNLQRKCNTCFILDPHFNLATDDQAAQRIDRIGQTKPVLIKRLFMEGSIDEALRIMQNAKQKTIDTWMTPGAKKDHTQHGIFLEKYDTVTDPYC